MREVTTLGGTAEALASRLKQAAEPFVDALPELVQAQADTTGFVVLRRRAEIRERYFPPEFPDPDQGTD